MAEGAGHHLFVFTSVPSRAEKEDEELGRDVQSWFRNVFCEASHIDTSYSRVS